MGDDVDLVAAKRKVDGAARQMLEHARALIDLVDRAAASPAAVEQAVRHHVGELLNEQATNNLRRFPAAKLRGSSARACGSESWRTTFTRWPMWWRCRHRCCRPCWVSVRRQPRRSTRHLGSFSRIDGHAVLLSQIEAGGVGLNAQVASVVIIAEPQWKPSTEAQAIGRAHRMGQTRKVHVHRLLAKNSVDERMREIIEEKQQLFDVYARKSAAKEADARAVDSSLHQTVDVTRDEAVPAEQRIIAAERQRLGLDSSTR